MNAIYCLSRALRTVLKSPNLMKLLKIFFRLCVCFFLYVSTCSKGHSIRVYLDTIQMTLKMTAIRGKLFYARSLKPNSYKTYGHFHQGTGLRSLTWLLVRLKPRPYKLFVSTGASSFGTFMQSQWNFARLFILIGWKWNAAQ